MILTEEQAIMKWCPMARILFVTGSDQVPSFGDALTSTSYNRNSNANARCIASGCMLWSWRTYEGDHKEIIVSQTSGYCGLSRGEK